MGIYDFFSKFIRRLPQNVVVSLASKKEVSIIEGLSFDVNAILHTVAQEVFMYGSGGVEAFPSPEAFFEARKAKEESMDKTALENLFVKNVINEFARIVAAKHISQYLFFMFDGIAPNAKIQQQRSRRFKSAIEDEESGGGVVPRPLGGFNSSFLSPGTPIMKLIADNLALWINKNRNLLPPVVVLSTSEVPGEGEHKIFETFRSLTREGTISQGTKPHVIWSLDSDLAILSCLSEDPRNIFLARQRWDEAISIEILRNEIVKLLSQDSRPEELSIQNFLTDFVVVSCLIGNDFLPRSILHPNLNDKIIRAYQQVGGFLTHRGTIIIQNLLRFFWMLARYDKELASEVLEKEIQDEGDEKTRRVAPTATLRAAALDANKAPQPLDFERFKRYYYREISDLFKKTSSAPAGPAASASEICKAYCYGLEWVLKYYTGGGKEINWLYEYPYINAPLPGDVAIVLKNELLPAATAAGTGPLLEDYLRNHFPATTQYGVTANDGWLLSRGKTPLSIGVQLLAIIPNNILQLIFGKGTTKNFANLTSPDKGPLSFLSPADLRSIRFYGNGKFKKFQAPPLIPRFDFFIVKALIDQLDAELCEKQRLSQFEFWKMVNADALKVREDYENYFISRGKTPPAGKELSGSGKIAIPAEKKAPAKAAGRKKKGDDDDEDLPPPPPKLRFVAPVCPSTESRVIPPSLQVVGRPQILKSSYLKRGDDDDGKPPILNLSKKPDEVYVALKKLEAIAATAAMASGATAGADRYACKNAAEIVSSRF
jgi:hypothetical protein